MPYSDPEKQKAYKRKHDREYRQRPEVRDRINERQRERNKTPKQKAYFKEYHQRPEVKKRVKKYNQKPEVKKAHERSNEKYWQKTENVEKRLKKKHEKSLKALRLIEKNQCNGDGKYSCNGCFREFPLWNLTKDHITPEWFEEGSKEGDIEKNSKKPFEYGFGKDDSVENFHLLCHACNTTKRRDDMDVLYERNLATGIITIADMTPAYEGLTYALDIHLNRG